MFVSGRPVLRRVMPGIARTARSRPYTRGANHGSGYSIRRSGVHKRTMLWRFAGPPRRRSTRISAISVGTARALRICVRCGQGAVRCISATGAGLRLTASSRQLTGWAACELVRPVENAPRAPATASDRPARRVLSGAAALGGECRRLGAGTRATRPCAIWCAPAPRRWRACARRPASSSRASCCGTPGVPAWACNWTKKHRVSGSRGLRSSIPPPGSCAGIHPAVDDAAAGLARIEDQIRNAFSRSGRWRPVVEGHSRRLRGFSFISRRHRDGRDEGPRPLLQSTPADF